MNNDRKRRDKRMRNKKRNRRNKRLDEEGRGGKKRK